MQEQKSESTLMRKTKKELVEIIFRKDDVELKLKNELKLKDEQIETLNANIEGCKKDILGMSHAAECDRNTINNLVNGVNKLNKRNKALMITIATIVLVAGIIIACIA